MSGEQTQNNTNTSARSEESKPEKRDSGVGSIADNMDKENIVPEKPQVVKHKPLPPTPNIPEYVAPEDIYLEPRSLSNPVPLKKPEMDAGIYSISPEDPIYAEIDKKNGYIEIVPEHPHSEPRSLQETPATYEIPQVQKNSRQSDTEHIYETIPNVKTEMDDTNISRSQQLARRPLPPLPSEIDKKKEAFTSHYEQPVPVAEPTYETPVSLTPPAHTYETPVAAHTYEIPVPAHTYETPVPAHTYETPVPAHTYETPVPAHTYETPIPAHTYETPVPAHTYETPVPAHTYETPVPAHTYETPVPAHTYETPVSLTPPEPTDEIPQISKYSQKSDKEPIYQTIPDVKKKKTTISKLYNKSVKVLNQVKDTLSHYIPRLGSSRSNNSTPYTPPNPGKNSQLGGKNPSRHGGRE